MSDICYATGKRKYLTPLLAERDLKRIRLNGIKSQKGLPRRVYLCPICLEYHLTSQLRNTSKPTTPNTKENL